MTATTPEVRRCLGLDPGGCPFFKVSGTNQSPTNPTITPSFSPEPTPTLLPERIERIPINPKFRLLNVALQKQNWIEAEQATNKLKPKELECEDLQYIDQLWLKYSNNKFGYSVQRKIWESEIINQDYQDFAMVMGWLRRYRDEDSMNIKVAATIKDFKTINDSNFLDKAYKGQLPFNNWQISPPFWYREGFGWYISSPSEHRQGFGAFMSKLKSCKI
jgi:hypothetical protein